MSLPQILFNHAWRSIGILLAFMDTTQVLSGVAEVPCEKHYRSLAGLSQKADAQIAASMNQIYERIFDGNVRFPQMNLGAVLSGTAELLNHPVPLARLLAPADESRIASAARILNRVHEAYGIPVAAGDFETTRKVKRIPLSRVGESVDYFTSFSALRVIQLVGEIMRAKDSSFTAVSRLNETKNLSPELMSKVDHFFTSKEFSKELSVLRRIASCVDLVLRSDSVKALSASYRSALRPHTGETTSEAFKQRDNQRRTAAFLLKREVSSQLSDRMGTELPELNPSQLEILHSILVSDF